MRSTDLIARKGALKRVKAETRVVGRPKAKNALKRALCENLQKVCDALSNAAFEVRNHPYLPGVRCRSDGNVWVPPNGSRPGHWTFGHKMLNGYRDVVIQRQHLYVHRLICETFHGLCPEGCEVDHSDRDPSNNKEDNLHWVSRSENMRNRDIRDASLAKYGVSQVDDKAAYDKAYQKHRWATSPEYREQRRQAAARYRAKKKAKQKE